VPPYPTDVLVPPLFPEDENQLLLLLLLLRLLLLLLLLDGVQKDEVQDDDGVDCVVGEVWLPKL